MRYFLISFSTEKDEVGDYPQTEATEAPNADGSFDANSRSNLSNKSFPQTNPDFNLRLTKGAKLTDIISPSNTHLKGLFFNKKVRDLLEGFNIMNHKYYEGEVVRRGEEVACSWLHIVNDNFDGINFGESSFREVDIIGDVEDEGVVVSSGKQLMERWRSCDDMNMLEMEKIKLNQGFDYDVFLFPFIHNYVIVSENVIRELNKYGVTGYKSQEINMS